MKIKHSLRLGGIAMLLIAIVAALFAGCASNRKVDESFLREVEKDPFPSASSKGLAVKKTADKD
jgi:hypothetical protein